MKLVTCISIFYFCFSLLFSQTIQNDLPMPLDPKLRQGMLPNGMKYYIRANALPENRANFHIVHYAGAVLEEDNQNGLAHFTEHMAFNGTKHFPKNTMINYLETIGVKFGNNLNAFTSYDITQYMITDVPLFREGIVDTALLVLHDWSNYISFESEELEKERGVIREEWRTRNTGERRMMEFMLQTLLAGTRYESRNVIGDTAVINNFKINEIKDFYYRWYRPDLQAVIVVGDFDVDSMENKVMKLFSSIPSAKETPVKPVYRVPKNKDIKVGIATDKELPNPRIYVFFKQEPVSTLQKGHAYYKESIMQSMLLGMLNDRYNELNLNPNNPFVTASSSYSSITEGTDAMMIFGVAKNNLIKESYASILEILYKARQHGFTITEFERAKLDLLSHYEQALKEKDKQKHDSYVREYADLFVENEPAPGIEYEFTYLKEIFTQLTVDQINILLKKYITDENVVVTVMAPEKDDVIVPDKPTLVQLFNETKSKLYEPYIDKVSANGLVDKLSPKGKIKKVKALDTYGAQELTLSNGIKVLVKKTDFKNDEILLYAYSKGGVSQLDDNYVASAGLTIPIMMEMGLGNLNKTELEKYLTGKKVQLAPFINDSQEGFRGSVSPDNFSYLMELVYTYFQQPRKDEQAYSAFMQRYKESNALRASNPRMVLSDSISFLMGNRHFRSRPLNNDVLNEVKLENIWNVYTQRFNDPASFTFVFIGNIHLDSISPLLEKYLASLPNKKKKEDYIFRPNEMPDGKQLLSFEKELQVPKTSVFIVYSAQVNYGLKDNLILSALESVLRNRYIKTIREEKGASYGVSVSVRPDPVKGKKSVVQMFFDTEPALADEMKAIIVDEFKKIAQNGPEKEDLDKAKEFFLKSYQQALKENSYWQSVLSELYDSGMDKYSGYEEIVKNIHQDDLKALAAKFLIQGNYIEVVMKPKM